MSNATESPPIFLTIADEADWRGSAYPEELAIISGASPVRRREFLAGRSCARRALRRLGYRHFPLLADPQRVPLWPAGVKGSISHSMDDCIVIATMDPAIRSLGVDIEKQSPLPIELHPLVCSTRERAWAVDRRGASCHDLHTLLFSAKESVFKCLFPLYREFFEFLDLEIEIDVERFTFRLGVCAATRRWPIAATIEGSILSHSPAMTMAILPHDLPGRYSFAPLIQFDCVQQ